jgi:integrase
VNAHLDRYVSRSGPRHRATVYVDIQHGGPKRIRTPWRAKRADALADRDDTLHQIRAGIYVEPSELTFPGYMRMWLESSKLSRSRRTQERYESILKVHLKPAFAKTRLHQLTAFDLERWYGVLSESLAPATIRKTHWMLHQAFATAAKRRLIAVNVAADASPPREQAEPRIHALSEADTERFLAFLFDDLSTRVNHGSSSLYLPCLVGFTTGLRRGELLALKVGDLEGDRLHVRHSLEQSSQGLRMKAPKTTAARRTLPLLPMTVDALAKQRRARSQAKLAFGGTYERHDLVFPALDFAREGRFPGRYWTPSSFTRLFCHAAKRFAKQVDDGATFACLTPHDMRHTFATLMLRATGDYKLVAQLLGDDVSTTMRTYAHVLPDTQAGAVDALQERLAASFAHLA